MPSLPRCSFPRCHQKEEGNSVGNHYNVGQDSFYLFTVARQSATAVQSLAPEVIAKRTKRHLDELEAGIQNTLWKHN